MSSAPAVLVMGYGNPAREDDGLGPMVAEEIGRLGLDDVEVDCAYQPAVEDAAAVAEHSTVVFVDAAVDGPEPFSWAPVEPTSGYDFSTHALTARGVTGLARELLGAAGRAYLLGVRGYSFRMFRETATEDGARNARSAARFLAGWLGSERTETERGRP